MKELIFNKRLNLLEEESFDYNLVEVSKPQLYREIYPYEEIPKTAFNHRIVEKNMPSEIWITDTTFRDGQQANIPYTVEQIHSIYKMLHKLGGPNGIIRQSEFFVYSEKDREAVYKCLETGYKFPEITTWIRATNTDLELVKDLNIRETGVLVSCSDYHIFNKLKMNRKQAFDHYVKVVENILDFGISPRCHLEDVTRADFYGFVVPLVSKFMKMSIQSKIPIKIRLCDTLGLGFPFSGSILPRSVPGLISGLQHFADVPSELIEWHGHNDFYLGVSNAISAWLYGASSVNCSLFGIGERTGNVPLEAMAIQYASLRGTTSGMELSTITEIAEYFKEELKYTIPPMTPFVGSDFNSTKAGIHADGLLKDEEIYNIFDTNKILNRPVSIAITSTSGLAGLAYWYNHSYSNNKAISKQDPIIKFMKTWVDEQYANGRQTSISDAELRDLVNEYNSQYTE